MCSYQNSVEDILNEFQKELDQARSLNDLNQQQFAMRLEGHNSLSRDQLEVMTEFAFFRAFRAYENFICNLFLVYCLNNVMSPEMCIHSYLNPKDLSHAEKLLQSSMNHLDWANPEVVIARAEVYLENGSPIKKPLAAHRSVLQDCRIIRNHIAHNSSESRRKYLNTLQHYGIISLEPPTPGAFLLLPTRTNKKVYYLQDFLDSLDQLSSQLTRPIQ